MYECQKATIKRLFAVDFIGILLHYILKNVQRYKLFLDKYS